MSRANEADDRAEAAGRYLTDGDSRARGLLDRDHVALREQAGFTGERAKWVERVLECLKIACV